MRSDKYAFWFSVIVGPLLGGFLAYFVSASVLGEYSWCITGKEEHCVREWVSATSGWAAALAAVVAIVPLLGQLREQRRQTSFVLGDAAPTVDIKRRAPLSLLVRIVNWNRRPLSVRPIQITIAGEPYAIRSILSESENQKPTNVGNYGFAIGGWEDRASRPSFSELAIEIEDGPKVSDFNQPMVVEIVGELIGEGGGHYSRQVVVDHWGHMAS